MDPIHARKAQLPESIFGSATRTDPSPSRHAESTYAFLSRVAGPVWDQCRALIDDWLAAYPVEGRASVAARLRSNDDWVFTSAFWELYLHEMYRRDGWTIVIEPPIPGASTRPDFLVSKGESAYYVEARCMFPRGDRGGAARLQSVYDSLNTMDSGAFLLAVTPIQIGSQSPPTGKLRRALESWLASLDPDAGDFSLQDDHPDRRFEWSWQDWQLLFFPIPRALRLRSSPARRPLGAFIPAEAAFIDDITPLKEALSEKGSKYGYLDHPLVIAINTTSGFHDEEDTMQVLYGQIGWRTNVEDPQAEATPVLTDDGYWGRPGRPCHPHVAGLLLAEGMHYGRVGRYAPVFWPHPYTTETIEPLANWGVTQPSVEGLEYRRPWRLPHEYFGLEEGWPIGDPFPRGQASS